MKSKARIESHPMHPMLIAFPIAFLVGGFLADLIGRLADWPTVYTTGGYLSVAGVISGLIAGVPGFIDYLYVVPPNSSASKRATWHMCINLVALGLVALGWCFRDWHTVRPAWAAIILELLANGLLGCGGWLGATLIYRDEIGIDRRYAHSGKWHEESISGAPGEMVSLDGAQELKPGQMWLLRWTPKNTEKSTERRLVLARTDDGFAAFDDHCPHKGGSLAGGALICGTVQCPWHGSQFDVNSGQVKAGPAEKSIATYRAELVDGKVRMTLPMA